MLENNAALEHEHAGVHLATLTQIIQRGVTSGVDVSILPLADGSNGRIVGW